MVGQIKQLLLWNSEAKFPKRWQMKGQLQFPIPFRVWSTFFLALGVPRTVMFGMAPPAFNTLVIWAENFLVNATRATIILMV